VSSLTFGSGDGFLDMPDMRGPSLSTQVIFTSTITAFDVIAFQTFTSSQRVSSLQFRDLGAGNLGTLVLSNGLLYLNGSQIGSGGGGGSGDVTSTNLTSTTLGLGTLGYVSTFTLFSTVNGLGLLGYISSATLASTLQSTVRGLGTVGYLSSAVQGTDLTSTTFALGTLGYISALTLQSSLISTTAGLGNLYKSTYSNVPFFSSIQYFGSSFTGNLADAQTLIIQEL
jgi:hypothetical protein